MKNKRAFLVMGLAILVAFVFGAVQARADVYMKQKTHTGAFKMMGPSQPEKDEFMIYWLAPGKARTDQDGGKSFIFLADKKILYALDHNEKTYAEVPMSIDKMIEEGVEDEEDQEEAKKMAEMMKGIAGGMMGSMSVKVTETGETKKIRDWNCRKYLVETNMGPMKSQSETWATQDLKVDYNLYFAVANAMMSMMPGYDKLVQEMQQIKGVIVYQTSTTKMMGQDMTMTMEVLEHSEKSAPAGTYDIPAGYKKVKGMGRGF